MSHMNKDTWVLVVLPFLTVVLSACDECEALSQRCEGEVLHSCTWYGKKTTEDCGMDSRYCISPAKGAKFCAVERTPAPECKSSSWAACRGAVLYYCGRGYFSTVVDRCTSTAHCRASIGRCTLTPGLDPICQRTGLDGSGTICDGDNEVKCIDGFRTEQTACGAGLCYAFDGSATCIESKIIDPSCKTGASRRYTHHCDGNTVVHCIDGYVTERAPCDANLECTETGEQAHCLP